MAKRVIKIKNYSDVVEEYPAHAAITPGNLIEVNSDGEVQKHATAGGTVLPMFALEDSMQGKDIDDAYATGDQVQCWIPGRGDIVYALLADGENVAKGAVLVSNGDGTLKATTETSAAVADYSNSVVGIALEAVDMSGSSAVDPSGRIQVRII